MTVNIVPILLCDPGGVWVIRNAEAMLIRIVMIDPVFRSTVLIPERVILLFI